MMVSGVKTGLMVLLLTSSVCKSTWQGHTYWNDRYGDKLISQYTTDDTDNGLWSDYSKKYPQTDFSGRQCSGCTCDENNQILKNCNSNTITIKNYSFKNITTSTFSSSVQSITIINCADFDTIEPGTFDLLVNLNELVIQKTSITVLPNLRNTKVEILNLVENQIDITTDNYDVDRPYLPSTITHLALMNNKIGWLPPNFASGTNLRILSLAGNVMESFPSTALNNLTQLVYLGLDGNKIRSISQKNVQALITSPDLVHLNFSNNVIKTIAPEAFNLVSNLKILELHGNSLVKINWKVFKNISELLHLDLHKNKVEKIGSQAFVNLPKLMELRIHSQNPAMISISYDAFQNIGEELVYLFVSDNGLTTYPHQVLGEYSYPKLKEMHADHNRITNVTVYGEEAFTISLRTLYEEKSHVFKPFSTTPALLILYLNDNLLTEIRESDYCELGALNELYLDSNLLTEVTITEKAFACLTNLNLLYLSSNKIQYVPEAVKNADYLPSISTLNLASNKLTFLEKGSFSNLTTLRVIYLSQNGIIAVEDGTFPDDITTIYLGYNEFNFLHETVFANLENLATLSLRNNRIDKLPWTAFHNCTSLVSLTLTNNQIAQILKTHLKDCPLTSALYLANNHIGYIEDGSLSHLTSITHITLENNELTELPNGGDFHDLTVGGSLTLQGNRITHLPTGVFKGLSVGSSLNLENNKISRVDGGAFENVVVGYTLSFDGNPLRELAPYAFNVTSARYFDLSSVSLTQLHSYVFNKVSVSLDFRLNGNNIKTIQPNAFFSLTVNRYMYLQNNELQVLSGQVFGTGASVNHLHLENNNLTVITRDNFMGVTLQKLSISDNLIQVYPGAALATQSLQDIDFSGNLLSDIPDGSFAGQSSLATLTLTGNKLTTLQAGLFTPLTALKQLVLDENEVSWIEEGAFEGLDLLTELSIRQNSLTHFPELPALSELTTINLEDNQISTFGNMTFQNLNPDKISTISLTGNPLSCECNTVYSLDKVSSTLTGAVCDEPVGTQGTIFDPKKQTSPIHYTNMDPTVFLCTGSNLTATAPDVYQLRLDWDQPDTIYIHLTNKPEQQLASNTEPLVYGVSCSSSSAVNLSATVTDIPGTELSLSHTFTQVDGVELGTDYRCTVELTVTNTSSQSAPVLITTLEAPVNVTVANEGDITLEILYYDFSSSHSDFTRAGFTAVVQPSYIPSPYGAWLAISDTPTTDSFSDWFRSSSANNQMFNQTLTLSHQSDSIYRFWSSTFYPVDGQGYGSQGQQDCSAQRHNLGFTSAVRTGLKFNGSEVITVGGGEEIWLYINKILVLELLSGETTCQQIDLSTASGNGYITPSQGSLMNGQCVGLSPLGTSTVNINLQVGETYHFALFHTERSGCSSSLLLQTDSTVFITTADNPPADYLLSIPEDFHLNGLLETIYLTDSFSVGPTFSVSLQTGNEARHFTLKSNTVSNIADAVAPPPEPLNYTSVSGVNVSYVECVGGVNSIPEPYNISSEDFTLSTQSALLTLATALDFETAQSYFLLIHTVDPGLSLTGQITIKISVTDVNDNCPVLTLHSYSFVPIPALQINPLVSLSATDADSSTNAELIYIHSAITENPVVSYNATQDLYSYIYVRNTTLTFDLVVIDKGSPVRGTSATVEITLGNSCFVDADFNNIPYHVNVNSSSGEVTLRIPGYYVYKFACDGEVGVSSGYIPDDYLSASSSLNTLTLPARGRLHLNASSAELGGLSGGWVAGNLDTNQYIQLDMKEDYKFTAIQIQGRQDESQWVTSFQLLYSDSDSGPWNLYSNGSGVSVFDGNVDQHQIVYVPLDPPILSQLLRINPQSWHSNIALRFEMNGCQQSEQLYYDSACERCPTTYYCEGDGEERPCGRCTDNTTFCDRSPVEHSFGAAHTCSPCPTGWICSEGYATRCPELHYAVCNSTFCPEECTLCETGYACRGGEKYLCELGTYANVPMLFCASCPPGTYQDEVGQSSCKTCPRGFYSSERKDKCNRCPVDTYSLGDGSDCQACSSEAGCPCMSTPGPCFSPDLCHNLGTGSYECEACPPGYVGDGTSCVDINECVENRPCWNVSACINTEPGYQCSECPSGYVGTFEDAWALNYTRRVFLLTNEMLAPLQYQVCNDVDECAVDNGGCDSNSRCVNLVGSFSCGFCSDGYVGSVLEGCTPADFCTSNQHSCTGDAECVYLGPGEFICQCKVGYAGNGDMCGKDTDGDGHPDISLTCSDVGCSRDNCVLIPNSGQENNDGDYIGDDCDIDDDNDGIYDLSDNCVLMSNVGQEDVDNDGVGDICDNCPSMINADQKDTDGDGDGDDCDADTDGDGITDVVDNCPLVVNPGQENTGDSDSVGDACDNCVAVNNNDQADTDQNGVGDACDTPGAINKDLDGDSILDFLDNCPNHPNSEQIDTDNDDTGDACDPDIDGDLILNDVDNCPYLPNVGQTDANGNGVGDDCEIDSDGDNTVNSLDDCPLNKDINFTSFQPYTTINLDPTITDPAPVWVVTHLGRNLRQTQVTEQVAMLIGNQVYSEVEYSGTLHVTQSQFNNYVGFVFGYVNNRKFYVVVWRHDNLNYGGTSYKGGIKGIQIKLVDSSTGPGQTMTNAIWHSISTTNQVTLLWHDPAMIGWQHDVSYRWVLVHRPSIGQISLRIYNGSEFLVESGPVYDSTITGGKLGVMMFGQPGVIWSQLKAPCLQPQNQALQFDGLNDFITLTDFNSLNITDSFTFSAWVQLSSGFVGTQPVICTLDMEICLYIENSRVHANVSNLGISGATTLTALHWNHLLLRYDAQDQILSLYINGTDTGVEAEMTGVSVTTDWTTANPVLNLGRNSDHYLEGILDEVRLYRIAIPTASINSHIEDISLVRHQLKNYLSARYPMMVSSGSLLDTSGNNLHGIVNGQPVSVQSWLSQARYQVTYPDSR